MRIDVRLLRIYAAAAAVALGVSSAGAAKACRKHGGVARCDANGQTVCKDGTLDKRFSCSAVTRGRKGTKKVLKFKKRPNRGQILDAGQTPPASTLQDSHRALQQ